MEKKRFHRVLEFYENKIEEIKSSKEKEMARLKAASQRESSKIEQLINKNAKLRLKKERSLRKVKLNQTYNVMDSERKQNPEKGTSSEHNC